jgi:hypothetical protein
MTEEGLDHRQRIAPYAVGIGINTVRVTGLKHPLLKRTIYGSVTYGTRTRPKHKQRGYNQR